MLPGEGACRGLKSLPLDDNGVISFINPRAPTSRLNLAAAGKFMEPLDTFGTLQNADIAQRPHARTSDKLPAPTTAGADMAWLGKLDKRDGRS